MPPSRRVLEEYRDKLHRKAREGDGLGKPPLRGKKSSASQESSFSPPPAARGEKPAPVWLRQSAPYAAPMAVPKGER
ncbi:hypothetical protein GP486_007513 [Trichoglossum hirsutum]|uniref:Uncharacterized protein n=1 Tax=Trichoglossum hirsutum TaxID=265104 RepID=A0A9P8II42_9PEZI|nr:hypothetical protein GP486_007513 [Trichoglossum hirsutum]